MRFLLSLCLNEATVKAFLCHLEDHSMHVLLMERKSLAKGLIQLYSFGCYLSFEDHMMKCLELKGAKGHRDNQGRDHEVLYKRE